MRIIGYRKADFTTKDGIEIKGWNAYIATEIDPRYPVLTKSCAIGYTGIDICKGSDVFEKHYCR